MFESAIPQAETGRLREKQEAAEARYLRAAELEKMKKQLQKSYDSSLRQMAEMVIKYTIYIVKSI